MLVAGWSLFLSGDLVRHVAVSALEFAIGFGLATVLGVALGFAMATNRAVQDSLDPWVSFFYSSPLVALIPFFILVFGVGISSKIAIIFLVSIFPILLNAFAGIRAADETLLEVGAAFNCTRWQVFQKILVPAALPYIVVGLRLGIGRALTGVVVAELFGSTAGLGWLIGTAGQSFDTPTVLFGVLMFSFFGVAMVEGLEMDRARGRALAQGRAGGPMIAPKLDVTRLSKYFYGRGGEVRKVLEDITVSIADGEFVCIVGASGCGKTTFIRCIAGLLPAEEGEVRIDGQAVTRPGADRGFVFQSDALMPWRTVMQNVLFGLEVRGRRLSETKPIGEKLLDLVGLTGFEDHYPNELSGGMRQRVNLARALAIEPQVLLMDEPFAALDAQTREIMQRELLKIWAKERKTVLFITHQIDEAIYLADRVLVFSHRPGRIAADIRIPFARPRDLALKRSPEFLKYVDEVWKLIEDEVVSAMTATRAGARREQGH